MRLVTVIQTTTLRRCREGYEFFKTLRQRKVDLAASRAVQAPA
jgi:hypothetical protein